MIRRLMVVLCVLMFVALGVAACFDDGGGDAKKSSSTSTRTDSMAPRDLDTEVYTGSMVIIRPGELPRMCKVVLTSMPPQCGDVDARPEFLSVDVKKFDDSQLTDRQEAGEVVWYHTVSITGHLDGTVLTATEPAVSVDKPSKYAW